MKKLILIVPLFTAFFAAMPILAKNTNSVSGNQAQNQVQTQNQGEEQEVQVQAQEEENFGEGQGEGLQIRNQNAVNNMSEVAKAVQEMLQVRTSGGIGEQVREVAQAQNQAQSQMQEHIQKMEARGKLFKFMFGPDFKAIENLTGAIEQNQNRIQLLQELQTQLTNANDKTMIQATIEAMIQQNTVLQEMVQSENQVRSLFGWLMKLFAK